MASNNNVLDICNFGINLKRIVHEKGYTTENFAFKIGVSNRIIYDYYDGFKNPSLKTIILIANVLGISLDDILRRA